MSRAATGDTVVVKPSNNVYTVLTIIATIAVTMSLIVLYVRSQQMGIQFF
jgi:hypothetical protein